MGTGTDLEFEGEYTDYVGTDFDAAAAAVAVVVAVGCGAGYYARGYAIEKPGQEAGYESWI